MAVTLRTEQGEYIKVAEAARRLDLTAETVRKHLRTGAIPGIYIGPQLRVDWTALREILARTGGIPPKPPRARKGH